MLKLLVKLVMIWQVLSKSSGQDLMCVSVNSFAFCADPTDVTPCPDGTYCSGDPLNPCQPCDPTIFFACLNSTSFVFCDTYQYVEGQDCATGSFCSSTDDYPCDSTTPPSEPFSCSATTISSTTEPIPTPPVCSVDTVGKYPYYDENGVNCRKYYDCHRVFSYYLMKEMNCTQGTGFSTEALECSNTVPCSL